MSKQPLWEVWNDGATVDVAPKGHRHLLGDRQCWCQPRTEEYAMPLIVHSLRVHDWFTPPVLGGRVACRRCGVCQNSGNADSFCKGPAGVGPRSNP